MKTVLFVLLGCILVADSLIRLPGNRVARAKARQARKTAEALARESSRVRTELLTGLAIVVVGLFVAFGH